MHNSMVPTAEFWEEYIATTWNQRARLIERMFNRNVADADRVFRIMQAAADHYRAGGNPNMSLYKNRGMIMADREPFLPAADDVSFESYCRRIDAKGMDEFTFMLFSCQLYDEELWAWGRRFLQGLYDRVGIPADHVDLDLFVGNYRRTGFGIHTDAAANFSFPIYGHKVMALWRGNTFAARPRTTEYSPFEKNRVILEADPGDMMFWTPEYWHVGIAEEPGWSATLNLALYIKRDPLSTVNKAFSLDKKAARRKQATDPPEVFAANATGVPAEITEELRVLREMVNDQSLEDTLSEWWVRKLSSGGFNPVPAQKPVQLVHEEDELDRGEFPIEIVRLADGRAIIGANGHALTHHSYEETFPLVRELNSASGVRVGDLLEQLNVPVEDCHVYCKLLAQLESFRAFTVGRASRENAAESRHAVMAD